MVVAINCRQLTHRKLEGFGNYTLELVTRWIEQHPDISFVLIFDREPKFLFPEYSHVKKVVIGPPTRHPVLYWLWFEWSIPRVLNREKATVFFSPDGYNSLRSTIPSLITVHDLNFEHNPKDLPRILGFYLRTFFPKFVRKANHVLTVSQFSKDDIVQKYPCQEEKITAIHNGASEAYLPVENSEKTQISNEICEGRPFFLFVGSLHPRKNVRRLLRAYAKLQDPKADLVIVGSAMWKSNDYSIPSSHVDRIHFLGYLNQQRLARIMASAMALAYVPYFEGFGIPLVEAMRCGTPILCSNTTCLPEVAGDAAIYCNPFDETEIHDGLLRLQNDANLREELSQKGLNRSQQFSWDTSAALAWEKLMAISGT